MAVDDRRRRRFSQYLKLGDGLLDAGVQTVNIDRLKAIAAVTFNAPPVAFHEDIRADFSISARHTHFDKRLRHEAPDERPWDIHFVFHKYSCCIIYSYYIGMCRRNQCCSGRQGQESATTTYLKTQKQTAASV